MMTLPFFVAHRMRAAGTKSTAHLVLSRQKALSFLVGIGYAKEVEVKGKRHIPPGPVQAIRKTPPPARFWLHRCRSGAPALFPPSEADASLGFMARMMAMMVGFGTTRPDPQQNHVPVILTNGEVTHNCLLP